MSILPNGIRLPSLNNPDPGEPAAEHSSIIDFQKVINPVTNRPLMIWPKDIGWRYWIGVTSTDGAQGTGVQAYIKVSQDGFLWEEAPNGIYNIDSEIGAGAQNDTELVYDFNTDSIICFWGQEACLVPMWGLVRRVINNDLTLAPTTLSIEMPKLVCGSPTIIVERDDLWHMWGGHCGDWIYTGDGKYNGWEIDDTIEGSITYQTSHDKGLTWGLNGVKDAFAYCTPPRLIQDNWPETYKYFPAPWHVSACLNPAVPRQVEFLWAYTEKDSPLVHTCCSLSNPTDMRAPLAGMYVLEPVSSIDNGGLYRSDFTFDRLSNGGIQMNLWYDGWKASEVSGHINFTSGQFPLINEFGIPQRPAGLVASNLAISSFTLAFDAVAGASKYRVYCGDVRWPDASAEFTSNSITLTDIPQDYKFAAWSVSAVVGGVEGVLSIPLTVDLDPNGVGVLESLPSLTVGVSPITGTVPGQGIGSVTPMYSLQLMTFGPTGVGQGANTLATEYITIQLTLSEPSLSQTDNEILYSDDSYVFIVLSSPELSPSVQPVNVMQAGSVTIQPSISEPALTPAYICYPYVVLNISGEVVPIYTLSGERWI